MVKNVFKKDSIVYSLQYREVLIFLNHVPSRNGLFIYAIDANLLIIYYYFEEMPFS
jgi:hypothetical protein